MTWTCIKCGQHNDLPYSPNIDWTHPQAMKYLKKIQAIEDRGEDPFAKCTYCRYDRSIKVK